MRAVEAVIARQVLHGGDLATNALELSEIPEATLTALLAESVGLDPAVGKLRPATPEMLRAIPSELALRHGVFPLELLRAGADARTDTLVIATSEPLPAPVEDDLSFALGVSLIQRAAPLVRIHQAQAEYYGLPIDRRYLRLAARLDGRAEPPSSSLPPAGERLTPLPRMSAPLPPGSIPGLRPASAAPAAELPAAAPQAPLTAPSILAGPPVTAPTPRSASAAPPSPSRAAGGPQGGPSPARDSAPRLPLGPRALSGWLKRALRAEPQHPDSEPLAEATPASAPTAPEPAPPSAAEIERAPRSVPVPPRPRRKGPFTVAMAEEELARGASTEAVIDVIFDFAQQYFEYAALFVVQGDVAEGRSAAGPGAGRDQVAALRVRLDPSGTLAQARDRCAPVVAALSPRGPDAELQRALGRSRPAAAAVAVLPISLRNRVVALIYGDDGEEPVELSVLGDVIALAGLAAPALERVILLKKRHRQGSFGLAPEGPETPVPPLVRALLEGSLPSRPSPTTVRDGHWLIGELSRLDNPHAVGAPSASAAAQPAVAEGSPAENGEAWVTADGEAWAAADDEATPAVDGHTTLEVKGEASLAADDEATVLMTYDEATPLLAADAAFAAQELAEAASAAADGAAGAAPARTREAAGAMEAAPATVDAAAVAAAAAAAARPSEPPDADPSLFGAAHRAPGGHRSDGLRLRGPRDASQGPLSARTRATLLDLANPSDAATFGRPPPSSRQRLEGVAKAPARELSIYAGQPGYAGYAGYAVHAGYAGHAVEAARARHTPSASVAPPTEPAPAPPTPVPPAPAPPAPSAPGERIEAIARAFGLRGTGVESELDVEDHDMVDGPLSVLSTRRIEPAAHVRVTAPASRPVSATAATESMPALHREEELPPEASPPPPDSGDDELYEDASSLVVDEVELSLLRRSAPPPDRSSVQRERREGFSSRPPSDWSSVQRERREGFSSRPPPDPREHAALLQRVLEGGAESARAFTELVRHGEAAMKAITARFPGPLRIDRRAREQLAAPDGGSSGRSAHEGGLPARPPSPLPPASQCGPLLELIVAIRRPALPFMTVRSSSPDPEIRFWATHVLGELRYPEAANALVPRLFDDEIAVRRIARRSAGALVHGDAPGQPSSRPRGADAPAGAPILQGLEHIVRDLEDAASRRVLAIETMAEIRAGAMIPPLIAALADPYESVVEAAARALAAIARDDLGRDPRAWSAWWARNSERHRVEWLIDALTHEQPPIRRAAGDELKALTREYFGYYDDLPRRERERAQARYREWWRSEGHARFHAPGR